MVSLGSGRAETGHPRHEHRTQDGEPGSDASASHRLPLGTAALPAAHAPDLPRIPRGVRDEAALVLDQRRAQGLGPALAHVCIMPNQRRVAS
eukprot:3937759-Prymnesium_polylepis.2